MTRQIKSYYEATRYLGEFMPGIEAFLGESACMGMERRQQLAIFEWIKEITDLDLEKLSMEEILDKIIIPLIKKLGYAEWIRDTVSDMAIKKGITEDKESFDIEEGNDKNE